jgi:thiol-disulfide isomerase/thioredoxin
MDKRFVLFLALFASAAILVQAQQSRQAAGVDTSSMLAPAIPEGGTDQPSMKAIPTMKGPTMTAPAMKGPAMKGPAMKAASSMTAGPAAVGTSVPAADTKVGYALMSAASVVRKLGFVDLAAASSYASKGPVVLFFAAAWCPYCQADLRDINANGARLGTDVTIFIVDYDKSADLKARYGIAVQDSFVQIDAGSRALATWNGGGVDAIARSIRR